MDEIDLLFWTTSRPNHMTVTYLPDRINDRWPKTQEDRQVFHNVMGNVLGLLKRAKTSSFTEIAMLMSEAFGENVSGRAVKKHLGRREGANSTSVLKNAGTVIPSAVLAAPAIAKSTRVIPDHNFHCEEQSDEEEDN